MAEVIITFKVMPEDIEVDLNKLEKEVKEFLNKHGEVGKTEREKIAFGLEAVVMIFVMDESKGSTDFIEDNIRNIDGVQSVEVTDVRRAIG
ncbi:elongation factor 1-beta [archaeon]|nr:elongation factor 1-beta [archaeon]|tara:strand:+ start:163 stop:435 length:273 start_codon:yes stop_codon:yes gene_type:complete